MLFICFRRYRPRFHYGGSAGQGIGDRQDTGNDAHNDTADIGVLGPAVNDMADQRSQRQDQHNGEQPDAHDTGDGIQEHFAGDEELDVLAHDHDLGSQEHKEHLPHNASPGGFAHPGVVVAVAGHAGDDVIHQPHRHKDQNHGNILCAEGTDGGEAPQAVVRQEQIIRQEYQREGGADHRHSQKDSLHQLGSADPDAPFFLVHRILLAPDHHPGTQAAQNAPQSDDPGRTLVPDSGLQNKAQKKCDEIEQDAEQGAEDIVPPVALFRFTLQGGPGHDGRFRLQVAEEGGIQQCQGGKHHEHKETCDAQGIKGRLPLPDLIIGRQLQRRAQGFVKEVHAEADNPGGEMCPGMGDGRIVDGADGLLAVHLLGIVGIRLTGLQPRGIRTEMQEGLGCNLIDIVPGSIPVHPVEELVILAGNDGRVPGTELIVEIACVIVVHRIVGHQQSRGDESLLILQHSLPACQCAIGVTGNTDPGRIHKGQLSQIFHAVIQAVGVVFVVPPGIGRQNLGITVAVHADGQHNIAPAGIFHIIQVLHFPVVVPAVADHNAGGRCPGGSAFRHQQQCVQLVAAFGDKGQIMVLHMAKIRLKHGCSKGADQAQQKRNGCPKFRVVFHNVHSFHFYYICPQADVNRSTAFGPIGFFFRTGKRHPKRGSNFSPGDRTRFNQCVAAVQTGSKQMSTGHLYLDRSIPSFAPRRGTPKGVPLLGNS